MSLIRYHKFCLLLEMVVENQPDVIHDDVDQECGSLAMSCSSSCVNWGTPVDADQGN